MDAGQGRAFHEATGGSPVLEGIGGGGAGAKRGDMRIVSAALLALLASLAGTEAFAVQVQCAKHNLMVGLLSKKYSEKPVAMGTVNEDRFMQLFVSAKGSWTILVTKTNGEACILAAGQNWEKLPGVSGAEPAA